ncbi:hypothetical protein MHEI_41220 [Mycobacterium heidelbergense]|nr:hypothetical protein MHEI_41220 [Mycobacterium heidelbergense]
MAAGDGVAAGADGDTGPHPDATETPATPTQAPTSAARAAVAIRELNMMARKGWLEIRIASKR